MPAHWSPIESRIIYRLSLILPLWHTNCSPQYIADSVQTIAQSSSHPGRRSNDSYQCEESSSETVAFALLDLLPGTVSPTSFTILLMLICSNTISKLTFSPENIVSNVVSVLDAFINGAILIPIIIIINS